MPPTPFPIIVQLIRNWQKEQEEKLDLEHDLVMEKDRSVFPEHNLFTAAEYLGRNPVKVNHMP